MLAMRAEMQDLKESKEAESRTRDQRIDTLATNLSHAISAMKDLRKGGGAAAGSNAPPTPTSATSTTSRTTAVKSPVRTAASSSTPAKPPRTPSASKRLMSSTATSAARQRNPASTTTTPVKSTPKRATNSLKGDYQGDDASDEEISTILLDPSGMSDEELMRELESAKRQMKKVLLKKDRFVETPAKKNPRF